MPGSDRGERQAESGELFDVHIPFPKATLAAPRARPLNRVRPARATVAQARLPRPSAARGRLQSAPIEGSLAAAIRWGQWSDCGLKFLRLWRAPWCAAAPENRSIRPPTSSAICRAPQDAGVTTGAMQTSGYQLSEDELKFDCKKLTGLMQIRILQMRGYDSEQKGLRRRAGNSVAGDA